MIVLVRSFTYTHHESFSAEFLIHSSCWFSLMRNSLAHHWFTGRKTPSYLLTRTHFTLSLVRSSSYTPDAERSFCYIPHVSFIEEFSYTHRASFCEGFLLHS